MGGRALSTAPWVDALQRHLAAQTGAPVQLIETHLSWVLLTVHDAYKLKKPVHLPFVDFRTLDARRRSCEEELRLNRRLAAALYLAVLPVTGTAGAPRLGGAGPVLDHAVHMRRFAPGALFSERVRAGTLVPQEVDALADRLARFHATAAPAPADSPWGTPAVVAHAIRQVLDQLAGLAPEDCVQPLAAWFQARHDAQSAAWAKRRADGRVREGHGDLHLANIVCLPPASGGVTAFDCIEFDEALRWIDVMADLAFATMDLKAHGREDLAWRCLDGYLQGTGDYEGLGVLRGYEAYRACVRALAAGLRGGPGDDGPDYLAWAQRIAEPPGGSGPRLLITHGLSGSGKSHAAARLLEAAGAVRVRSDVERKRLFGLEALADSRASGLDIYTADASERTFGRLREAAGAALAAGYPVIVDAAFLRRAERQSFQALAARQGVPFAILHCQADSRRLRERIDARRAQGVDASEADGAVLARQLAWAEPLAEHERAAAIELRTDSPLDEAALVARWRSC